MRQRFCGGGDGEGQSPLNLGTSLLRTGNPDDGGRGCRPPSVLRRQRPAPGDPPMLGADGSRAKELLRRSAQHSSVEIILADAWKWHTSGRAIVQNLRD